MDQILQRMANFVKHNTRYQSAKFHWPMLSGSFFFGGDTPSDLHALKKPSRYRVNNACVCGFSERINILL